jgi:hypothetical protein
MADGFRIYSTTNGGTNWNESYASGSADLKQVIALASNSVVAYSESGTIYRYNGTTWSAVFTAPLNNLQQIYFPSSSVGYGVDQLGKVIKTVSGGASWATVYTHTASGESFNTLYFFNANEGFMAGDNGVLYKTTNGGTNWLKVFSGIPAGIKQLKFVDAQTGYAFTDQGTVFKSEDSGLHWSYFGVMSYIGVNHVSTSGTTLYYCGLYGNLGTLTSPKAPLVPGYISGDQLVCSGNVIDFAIASGDNMNYYWSIPGASLTANDNHALVKFPGAGEYTLSVQQFTPCGTSAARTLSIEVSNPVIPNILGPQLVASNSTVEFSVQDPEDESLYNWIVTGATSFDAEEENVSVTWGKDPGSVSLMETTKFGCRSAIMLMVTIDPSTIVGTPDANLIEASVSLYPNPATDRIFLESHLSSGVSVRVYNMMGQEFATGELQPFTNSTIHLASFPRGMYLVEVSGRSGKSVRKIIKE